MSFLKALVGNKSARLLNVVSNKVPYLQPLEHQRSIWGWLNSIFNQYDKSRVDEVGPDRACAEWLIRCGAAVKWSKDSDWFKDYNSLPSLDKSVVLTIYEIDATDSCVMSNGFPYLKGLQNCQKIIFHRAHYLDDDALLQLCHVEHCLKDLQVSTCGNVSADGINAISQLRRLRHLLIYDLPRITVPEKERCIKFLQGALPRCKIHFPYSQAWEVKSQEKAE